MSDENQSYRSQGGHERPRADSSASGQYASRGEGRARARASSAGSGARPTRRTRTSVGGSRTGSRDARGVRRSQTSAKGSSAAARPSRREVEGRSRTSGTPRSYTPHYRSSVATTYRPPRPQRRGIYKVVAVVVVVALAFGIGTVALGGPGPEGDGNGENTAEQVDETQGQKPAFEGMPGVNYPDQESLAWRDEDFAVDPSRQDWNFEKSDRKVMYLTFDDGPSKNTQRVLDILDQYGCKATFFVIGHDSDYFPMIAEAYHRGHTIGLHSMTHEYSDVYASTDAYFEDLEEIGEVVKEQIGYVPCFVRFPGGSSNTVSRNYEDGIMTELSQMVPEQGYQYYDWNLACGDGATVSTEEIYAETLIEPESSNIMLLCHDAGAKDTTVEALPAIIEHFQGLGYSFEAIDRSSWVSHHTVNN